jgi:hypothetical protein
MLSILADAAPSAGDPNLFSSLLLPFLPWLVVAGLMYFFVLLPVLKLGKAQKSRAERHSDAMEAKLDRLIELLERQSGGK